MQLFTAFLTCSLCMLSFVHAVPGLWKRDAPFEMVRNPGQRMDHSNKDEDAPQKYFHESRFHPHYDGRFAERRLKYHEHRASLRALVQTYFSTMRDIGIETFIMHGTLLGWWWNRLILPWDDDIDVMVTETSIHHLARYYNMTVHHYRLPGPDRKGRDYMLEVNPNYRNRTVDPSNMIDARWIDMDTGLYIDITTLRRNRTAEELGVPGAMMVKDKHKYTFDDVFPLRESIFESVPVNVPYAYAELLTEEYGAKALTDVIFENHKFDDEKKEWVPLNCKYFGSCGYYRNLVDGLKIPEDTSESSIQNVQDANGVARITWLKQSLEESETKPLPPRLRDRRP